MKINPRVILFLTVLALFVPPLGIALIVLYLLFGLGGEARKSVEYHRMDAWARQEPWSTGDDAVDDATLARMLEEKR